MLRDLVAEHDLDLVVRGVVSSIVSCSSAAASTIGIFDVGLHQDVGELDRMIDVRRGFRILAAPVAVFFRGEGRGLQHEFHVGRHG